ncbi:MAG: cell division protein FtsL [Xanthomonadaceae bacterium]|nr:cell division protein FtsL [Xanthomonadaceae bacterium]
MNRTAAVIALLAATVFVSAVAKVYVVHLNRTAFTDLQQFAAARDEMDIEWVQLQIEQATWSRHARIEEVATERLGMRTPDPARIVMVRR